MKLIKVLNYLEKNRFEFKTLFISEGQRKDFNANIIKYLKRKGIKICPSAIPGYNNNRSNPFRLRRISINV